MSRMVEPAMVAQSVDQTTGLQHAMPCGCLSEKVQSSNPRLSSLLVNVGQPEINISGRHRVSAGVLLHL